MLRIFSTPRIFAFLLTGVMITSCSGGTSSNTGANNNGGGDTTQAQDQPQSETISVPLLGFSTTIDQNTTFGEISSTANDLISQCVDRFGAVGQQTTLCRSQVTAAQNQAVRFINSN